MTESKLSFDDALDALLDWNNGEPPEDFAAEVSLCPEVDGVPGSASYVYNAYKIRNFAQALLACAEAAIEANEESRGDS